MELCVLQTTSSNANSTATHADNLGESQPEPELRRPPVIDIEPFDETPFSVSNVYFRIER